MVPLVLLTGFLGAGKVRPSPQFTSVMDASQTTLLNAWLNRADDSHRIAVIENGRQMDFPSADTSVSQNSDQLRWMRCWSRTVTTRCLL